MADATISVLSPVQGAAAPRLIDLARLAQYNPQLKDILHRAMNAYNSGRVSAVGVGINARDLARTALGSLSSFVGKRQEVAVGTGTVPATAVLALAVKGLLYTSVTEIITGLGVLAGGAVAVGAGAVGGGVGFAVGSGVNWVVDASIVALTGQSPAVWAYDATEVAVAWALDPATIAATDSAVAFVDDLHRTLMMGADEAIGMAFMNDRIESARQAGELR